MIFETSVLRRMILWGGLDVRRQKDSTLRLISSVRHFICSFASFNSEVSVRFSSSFALIASLTSWKSDFAVCNFVSRFAACAFRPLTSAVGKVFWFLTVSMSEIGRLKDLKAFKTIPTWFWNCVSVRVASLIWAISFLTRRRSSISFLVVVLIVEPMLYENKIAKNKQLQSHSFVFPFFINLRWTRFIL